ncbi:MAG TPA: HAMP domain-containing sensor histidine kinase [Gemmatimonadales bacterium]|nr:HAMP domain-containing sensor histidine kinase [Gemmatimonadales bacterium]
MPPIPFRHRILLTLLLLGALPSAVLVGGWAATLLRFNPAKTSQAALKPVLETGRDLLRVLDTTQMSPAEHRALHAHVRAIESTYTFSVQGFNYSRLKTVGLALAVAVLGVLLLYAAVLLSRSISRQLATPIDELVGWMSRIRRHEGLPPEEARGGAPEFAVLRSALRETAASLQQARTAELESERLRAFREVARRVAHEMKNPLTPVRFAIGQLDRSAISEQHEALEVLRVETARLEHLARDFANLGRLPEGPPADVDLGELLGELLRTSLPDTMKQTLLVAPDAPHIEGHYDPLRRAFSNLIRNAVEACGGVGSIDVTVSSEDDGVRVDLIDHGPGVPAERRSRIFEPYVTDKIEGTGLGLAIVKQAVDFHHGTVDVSETPNGGATFTVRLPRQPAGFPKPIAQRLNVDRRVADRRRRHE